MMKWNVMAYLLKEQVGSKELREKLTRCLIASQLLDRRDSTRKVLVAEDSYTYRRAVADMLKLMSCEVIETEDGMQALAIARQQLPDLIISDQQMPHMSGLDLLRQVRSLPGGERLPFVMLTSIGDGKTMAAAMAEGVSAYILKDETDPKSLKRQIQRALTTASAMA